MTRSRTSATTSRRLPFIRIPRRFPRGVASGGAPRARGDARRQLGMSLVEVIVAATLALIGFLVALVLYTAARNLFKKGEQATDQQQEVRAAYDLMVRDLRLAGYNWNASGEDRAGEEQIEGAWDGAITVRGDFDFEDTTKSTDPESVIAGSTNKATVGNDEIVTYCLRRASGSDITSTIFNADVTSSTTASSGGVTVAVRDGVREDVTLTGIASGTAQANPPYNLYRVTLNNDNGTYGSANFQTWTLLAQNIKTLTFVYRDANGNPISAATLGGTEANKTNRESIKKIDVTVVGMTALADNNYTDLADTNTATNHFRKFSLTTQVTPRNLGFKGRADVDTTPPSTPTGLAVCPGHCAAMVAKWNPNPANESVALYTVKYGTSAGALNQVVSTASTNVYVPGLTEDVTYYFAVRASDAGGNNSSYSSTVSSAVGDMAPTVTTPAVPANFTATGTGGVGAQNGKVDLAWSAVTTNIAPLACDPVSTIRDLAGYRVYRSTASTFTPNDGTNLIQSETIGTPAGTTTALGPLAVSYSDSAVVNCRSYYYNLKAVDTTSCSNKSTAMGTALNGQSTTSILPAAPTGVTSNRVSSSSATVSWSAVNTDTSSPTPQAIYIDTYKIFRAELNNADDPEIANYGSSIGQSTPPAVTYLDTSAPPATNGKKVWYKVSAVDDCPNESAKSTGALMNCTFNGTLNMTPVNSPPSLDPAPKTVTVTATGTDTFTSVTVVIVKSGGAQDDSRTIVSGSPWSYTWTPNQGAGTYVATAIVTNATGCSSSISRTWTIAISTCDTCASITPIDPIARQSDNGQNKSLQQNVVINTCSFALSITSAKIRPRSICTSGCTDPLRVEKVQYSATGTFTSETNPAASYAATIPGDPIDNAPLTTSVATFTTGLNLPANSSTAKIRWFFNSGSGGYTPASPIYTGSQSNKKSVLEADLCFMQTSNLCTPSCVSNIQLEP